MLHFNSLTKSKDNMINNYFKKLTGCLAFILCLMTNACSGVLDSAPDGKISLDDAFKDNEMTAAYLNTCYSYIPGGGCAYYFFMRGPVDWCDEAWDTDAEAESGLSSGRLYNGNASAANHPIYNISSENNNGDYWNRLWEGIRKCAIFLGRIDGATVTSEANRSRWKAEAHLLRAYYYSELLRWFGCPLPIERETYGWDFDYSTVKRSSYYEVVQFIIEDCNAALSSPELPWRITTDAEGYRLTKAVAEGIKSRMSIYMASPLYNQGQNYWEEAYQVNKASLASLRAQGYELYRQINYPTTWKDPEAFLPNDHAALFNEFFCNSMAFSSNPVDKETLYQTVSYAGDYFVDGVGAQGGYKAGTCPSQELIDCFESADGQPILNLARPYQDETTHLVPNFNPANTLHDEQNPYANRDPRFYATFYYNGSQRRCYWSFDETSASPENYPAERGYRTRVIATWEGEPQTGIHPTDRKATRTGYFQRKFLHPFSGAEVVQVSAAQNKAFRLGEVILNFAEAAAEANHLEEARAAVNEIRSRVGMPDLPAGLSKDELILRIRNERRVELALEGFRYFDVRRWNTPDGNLEKTDRWINAMWITRNADGSYTYRRGPVSRERLCWTQKYMWLPVPMNEVNILKALTGEDWQNPGW
jgi:hypothetical protein